MEGSLISVLSLGSKSRESIDDQLETDPAACASAAASWARSSNRRDAGDSSCWDVDVGRCGVDSSVVAVGELRGAY